jgi:hypothetical protein
MALWKVDFLLTDVRGNTTTVTYQLGNFVGTPDVEFPLVLNAVNQVKNALGNATDAEISQEAITMVSTLTAAAHPITGDAEINEEAVVSLRLDSALRQSATLRIPAPTEAIVPQTGSNLVMTAVPLTQFIAQMIDHVRFGANADIEILDPAQVTNAYWRSTKRRG